MEVVVLFLLPSEPTCRLQHSEHGTDLYAGNINIDISGDTANRYSILVVHFATWGGGRIEDGLDTEEGLADERREK